MSVLLILDGLVGVGKTTLSKALEGTCADLGLSVQIYAEAEVPTVTYDDHAVSAQDSNLRQLTRMPHPQHVWIDADQDTFERIGQELMELRLERAKRFVQAMHQVEAKLLIFDGGLFHRDLDCLWLMNIPLEWLYQHTLAYVKCLQSIEPVLVYLSQSDVEQGLRRIHALRGSMWHQGETRWLVDSPYGRQHEYRRFSGYLQLYQVLHQYHRELYEKLNMVKVSLETSQARWSEYAQELLSRLEMAPQAD